MKAVPVAAPCPAASNTAARLVPRVYLSRPGLVCCAGADYRTAFDAVLRGDQRGIVPVTMNGPSGAGGLPGTVSPEAGGRHFLVGRVIVPVSQSVQSVSQNGQPEKNRILGFCAAALEQIRPCVEAALARWGPDRVGVTVGSCDNGTEWSIPAHRVFFEQGTFPPGYQLSLQGASGPAGYAAAYFGLRGPVLALATACASSAAAIIRGAELIQAGVCDAVIAGGADLASDTVLLGFSALEAVSPELSNPFSKNRKGINLGEGAAFFVLSREALDEPGGGAIVLAGYGESTDAHHMTAPHPEGAGAASAMKAALDSADIGPEAVGYVNLHGTGTPLNDQAEALAMYRIFGSAQPPASSTKPVTGHTLGAAGALELAICWGVMEGAVLGGNGVDAAGHSAAGYNADEYGTFPPHCWDGEADTALPPLNLAGKTPADKAAAADRARGGKERLEEGRKIRYCMSNSFAFGGSNVSLILGRETGVCVR